MKKSGSDRMEGQFDVKRCHEGEGAADAYICNRLALFLQAGMEAGVGVPYMIVSPSGVHHSYHRSDWKLQDL